MHSSQHGLFGTQSFMPTTWPEGFFMNIMSSISCTGCLPKDIARPECGQVSLGDLGDLPLVMCRFWDARRSIGMLCTAMRNLTRQVTSQATFRDCRNRSAMPDAQGVVSTSTSCLAQAARGWKPNFVTACMEWTGNPGDKLDKTCVSECLSLHKHHASSSVSVMSGPCWIGAPGNFGRQQHQEAAS